MIKLLKESTFQIKEVMSDSISIMLKKYVPIASLCFLLFLITTFSSVLSGIEFTNIFWALLYKLSGLIGTVVVFFVFYLFLLKYILGIVDKSPHEVFDRFNFPTKRQIFNVIIASLLFVLTIIIAYFVLAVVIFPLVSARMISLGKAVALTTALGSLLFGYLVVKISFFPFFIIDGNERPVESIKMSFALTKGNFFKIVILFGLLLMLYSIYIYLNYINQVLISLIVNVLTSFVVVPLSSVVLAVAYRNMRNNFKGEIHSDILENII